ncbi:hypothetical protein C7S15_6990 [Burkholderia cepacia]|nr:hypothetical protein [Burkholderia cepacia]
MVNANPASVSAESQCRHPVHAVLDAPTRSPAYTTRAAPERRFDTW